MAEDLAERFGDDVVRVAKMDGTINEVIGLDVEAYPTLLFWPAVAGLTAAGGVFHRCCIMLYFVAIRRSSLAEHGSTLAGVMADGQTPWTWTYEREEMLVQMRDMLYGLAKDHEFEGVVRRANERKAASAAGGEDEDELQLQDEEAADGVNEQVGKVQVREMVRIQLGITDSTRLGPLVGVFLCPF